MDSELYAGGVQHAGGMLYAGGVQHAGGELYAGGVQQVTRAAREELPGFSIDDDFAYIVPLALAACAESKELEFLASPWSPPAWAKTNRSMKGGGYLRRKYAYTWARMIARCIAEYRALGVNITRLTVQNEPEAIQTWESCLFDAVAERAFIHEHLRPALRDYGLQDVKVLIWDHNKQSIVERVSGLLGSEANGRIDGEIDGDNTGGIDGVAFHWYSGDHFESLRLVRDALGPNRELVFSEGCDFYSKGDPSWELPHAEHYAHEIIGDLESGANAILDWNILLDEEGGPNHAGNFCDAPLMYDTKAHVLNVRLPYYYIGHFSRFIQRGARRVFSTRYTTDLETCAFRNPDESFVLVALNRTERVIPFTLSWGSTASERKATDAIAPPHSIQTLVWEGL